MKIINIKADTIQDLPNEQILYHALNETEKGVFQNMDRFIVIGIGDNEDRTVSVNFVKNMDVCEAITAIEMAKLLLLQVV